MIPHNRRFAAAHTGVLGALALGALLAACEAALPTDEEVDRMDVASAEHATRVAGLLTRRDDSHAVYLIDGSHATAETAHALTSERIASVSVARSEVPGTQSVIAIRTRDGAARSTPTAELVAAAAAPTHVPAREAEAGMTVDPGDVAADHVHRAPTVFAHERFEGLLFIDGVRATLADLHALDRSRIERVEVVKGAAAARLYRDPAARNGVIEVMTRKP